MWEKISIDSLREAGSVKWSTFPQTIGMFIAEMDLGIPPVVSEVISGQLGRGALGYLPAPVAEAAKEATAHLMASQFSWEVPASRVHLVPDVLSALRQTIAHLSTGPVVVPTPAYMPFLEVPLQCGAEIREVPSLVREGRYELDMAGIDAALADGGLLLLCNPWNPVGRVLERDELAAVEEIVTRRGAKVFADEIHCPLVLDGTHIPYASLSAATAEHTVTALAASKGWNIPGLKCAQMILGPADTEAFAPWAKPAADPVGILGPLAAAAVYRDDRGWRDKVLMVLRADRDITTERLAGIELLAGTRPEGTYISWIDASALAKRVGNPAEYLRAHGVALTDGSLSGRGYENHLRLVFASTPDILHEAFDRIQDACAKA
ncbi:MAG: aminotransferase class I/II-fold pyridoxal phosphate-dependent enzyme [Flaviflexus sp.]|nr:aminotransferase class I/II-fold pyridoxal phosphate-dependent enzyme [Flaviflexus sp.]